MDIHIAKEGGSGGCGSFHEGMNVWIGRCITGCNGERGRQGCDLLPILVAGTITTSMDVHTFAVQ